MSEMNYLGPVTIVRCPECGCEENVPHSHLPHRAPFALSEDEALLLSLTVGTILTSGFPFAAAPTPKGECILDALYTRLTNFALESR